MKWGRFQGRVSYQRTLGQGIKTEFHGNRDFYNMIKGIAIECSKLTNISDPEKILPIINNYIESISIKTGFNIFDYLDNTED